MNETNANPVPLYQMNPLNRFSDRALDYAKYRPSYPNSAINFILEGLVSSAELVAADVGAGTGISSRLLAQFGVRVIAIEPNAEMRRSADFHPLVEWREATAEATDLADGSVDLVTCFQAFHWFDPTPTLKEFRRILKLFGRLALVWNTRDNDDRFTSQYSELIQKLSNNHPAEKRTDSVKALLESPEFTNIRQSTFSSKQELDLSSLIGRARSTSYIPHEELARQMRSEVEKLHEKWADDRQLVCLCYRTEVYVAEPNNQALG